MAITITKGTANSLIDGISVKHLNEDILYFIDDMLLLQVRPIQVGEELEREVIVKAEFLTKEEKEILDRLLTRLGLERHIKQDIILNYNGWMIQ